jgi:Na+/pantothenate symporter
MILTYMFALMGIQSSPAFTMWTFGIKSPKPLAWQQAFMSTFVVGFALFFFTAFQGMGAKILELEGVMHFAKDSDVVPMLMMKMLPPFVLYRHRRIDPAAGYLLALYQEAGSRTCRADLGK